MLVKNKMKIGIGIVQAGETISRAIEKMENENLAALLVAHEHKIIGVLPRKEILERTLSAGLNPLSSMNILVTSLGIETCGINDPVAPLAGMMADKNTRFCIAVDGEEEYEGIIYYEDIADYKKGCLVHDASTA